MVATYREFCEDKTDFFAKHNGEWKVYTSPMIDNRYSKNYYCEDGAEWWEVNEIVTETAVVEIKGVPCKVSVEMWRTEYWSTEQRSKWMYQQA